MWKAIPNEAVFQLLCAMRVGSIIEAAHWYKFPCPKRTRVLYSANWANDVMRVSKPLAINQRLIDGKIEWKHIIRTIRIDNHTELLDDPGGSMKLRFSKIFYLVLAILFVLSPLTCVTTNASPVDGLAEEPPPTISESEDEFSLTPSTNAQLATPTEPDSWPMAAANPERTSWTPEEVRGQLSPEWYKPFEPYIPQKVQIIAAYDTLYISTANGLYALDAETGAEKWVYPTELPLGHSPTIHNGVAYVGGFDHKLHAIDAFTGLGLWTFEAYKGFQTNPLVVNGIVYTGNRDGFMYAIGAHGQPNQGSMVWKFKTDGPVLFSAAYKDGAIYFASNDSYAYALNAQNGVLIWKSDKLPGLGFHSWWPVVYRDIVIFSGSDAYRDSRRPFGGSLSNDLDRDDIYPDDVTTFVGPLGNEPGDWVGGTQTIDTSKSAFTANGGTTPITEYFEQKPWRRTYLVLSRETGQEATYDFDSDGQPEYAPLLWFGTHNGNRYPPIVGSDDVLYQSNNYIKGPSYIPGGQISGWKVGTPFISIPLDLSWWNAVDEPLAYSAGGNLIYWNRCCDRAAAAFDITQPGVGWNYFNYNLHTLIPGYDNSYYLATDEKVTGVQSSFGGVNGTYGYHGDTNPPIPYKGKVYMHRGNSVITFSSYSGEPAALSTALTKKVTDNVSPISITNLQDMLELEIQKMLDAGHLRPGYHPSGIVDIGLGYICGDDMDDYWHHPADTIIVLARALPLLSPNLQERTKAYLQREFTEFPPHTYNHIGWKDGASREIFDLPPDFEEQAATFRPQTSYSTYSFNGWKSAPYAFYALWKYAEIFGGSNEILQTALSRSLLMESFNSVPSNDTLLRMPYVLNAYIAGYLGYLELEELAGHPESTNIQSELRRLLELRSSSFSKDTPYLSKSYCRALNISRNFTFMVPELAQYLHDNALSRVQEAVNEYSTNAPYWFVSKAETEYGEGVLRHLYDYNAIFQAKAGILKDDYDELTKYIDIPAFPRGDLFYIEILTATLESGINLPKASPPIIKPGSGPYDNPILVTISSQDPSMSIHYTVDGTTPSTTSTQYSEPFMVFTSTTIKARSFQDGHHPSSIVVIDVTLNHTFDDVPFDHWAYDDIELLHQAGFVSGCSTDPMLYCPERILTRAESSVFSLRGVYGAVTEPPYPNPLSPTFSDVDPAFWGYGWIESLWHDGFTAGCSTDPLLFCPDNQHTRAEGSVFFLRIKYGSDYEPPPPQGIFTDVITDAWYADWVEAAYNEGILPACQVDPLRFCPDDFLDRAWAAYMMVQSKGNLGSPAAISIQTPTPTNTPTQANPPTSTPTPSP